MFTTHNFFNNCFGYDYDTGFFEFGMNKRRHFLMFIHVNPHGVY